MPAPVMRTSGDLLADRRYAYAQASFEDGDFEAAADLALQAAELAPAYAPAHAMAGRALARLGRVDEARVALERALALEPEDTLGVRLDLARLGALPADAAMTDAYVRALFDDYAPRFDRHLVKNLSYRGPDLIADALRRAASRRIRDFHFAKALDLGCGTGLMAVALEGVVGWIEGVDLSPGMLKKARKTGLYAALHEGALEPFLQSRAAGEADLIVAADVFVYLAALDGVFRAAHRVLRRGGFFAFTVQAHEGQDEGESFTLGEDCRYAHGEAYLRRIADETGFKAVLFERASTREDRGEPVPGFLAVMER